MERMKQLLSGLDPALLHKAQQYLDSGKVISIKRFPDEIEGMMQERDTLLMPYYLLMKIPSAASASKATQCASIKQ